MAIQSILSKHVSNVVVSLATAAISWMAWSVQENNTRLAVLAEKVDRLERSDTTHHTSASAYTPPLLPYESDLGRVLALPVNLKDPVKYRKNDAH